MAKTPIIEIRRSRLKVGQPLTGKLASHSQALALESEIERVFANFPKNVQNQTRSSQEA